MINVKTLNAIESTRVDTWLKSMIKAVLQRILDDYPSCGGLKMEFEI